MKITLIIASFSGALILPTAAANYIIVGSAQTCQGEGLIEIAEAGKATLDQLKTARCSPEFSDRPVNVIAFQGRYTFLCDKLRGGPIDAFYCTYALTRDLRDSRGGRVPDQVSKEMVSPHFFDGK